jgi:hypothetical protein
VFADGGTLPGIASGGGRSPRISKTEQRGPRSKTEKKILVLSVLFITSVSSGLAMN